MAAWPGIRVNVEQYTADLDRSVDEVFSMMLGLSCMPVERCGHADREHVSAVIGLAGAMSGSMVLHSGVRAAIQMAELMTGTAAEALDEIVRDALGEICNMLAGAWKGRNPELCTGCLLSTPTVIAGSSYELFSQRAPLRIERSYGFGDFCFTVTIFCESCS